MKKVRKVAALLIAMVMVLMLGFTAFAEGEGDGQTPTKNNSITINNAKVGETYKIYKMFDLSVNSETAPTAYSYTINSAWAAFFAPASGETPAGDGYQYITVNDAGYVTAISDAAALAKKAAAWSGKPASPAQSVTVAAGASTAEFTNLDDGYWLVTSTLGTIAMAETTPDSSAVTIEEKNPLDTITKVVQEDSDSSWGAQNDAQIGDTVNFKSTIKIVKGTRNVVVHDVMDSGLSYTAGSASIEGLTKGTEYTVNESPTDSHTFDIAFAQSWIDTLDFGEAGYKEYVLTYSAVLKENAVVKGETAVAIVDQKNTTTITFGDQQSLQAQTTTKTHSFNVFKHATGKTDNLADAVFKLKKNGTALKLIKLDDNNYRVANGNETGVDTFTTVASGDIVIWGVDADSDYSLEETNAPKGYNKLTADVSVTVAADNSTRIDIENKTGTELPATGGIGTPIFIIVGGVIVAVAVILLIARKRAGSRK